ncbi:MAG: hypothetical protein LWX83_10150 [Anaerolineae bacterium]|nr:hypothetical protein [Anaerolineae bacterium]
MLLKNLKQYDIYLLALLMYVPFIFLGYGSDMDTYRVLWTGQRMATLLDYVPSRPPGFLVFETITYFLNSIGGSILTNLGAVVMSLVMIYCLKFILETYQIPNRFILLLILMVQPYYWMNSTCTMDFLFALGFSFLGFVLLLQGKNTFAGIAMGLAIGSRISAGLACAGFLLFLFITQPQQRRKLILSGFIMGLIGILVFLPSADFAGWSLRFMRPAVGGAEYWSLFLRAGRFVYKSLTFWSIPVIVLLAAALFLAFRRFKDIRQSPQAKIFIFSAVMLLAYEAFYFYIPTEPGYLLPTVPFMIILLGIILSDKRWMLVTIVLLLLASNFVAINVARPNVINKATEAEYGLWIEPGHMISDVQARANLAATGFRYESGQ